MVRWRATFRVQWLSGYTVNSVHHCTPGETEILSFFQVGFVCRVLVFKDPGPSLYRNIPFTDFNCAPKKPSTTVKPPKETRGFAGMSSIWITICDCSWCGTDHWVRLAFTNGFEDCRTKYLDNYGDDFTHIEPTPHKTQTTNRNKVNIPWNDACEWGNCHFDIAMVSLARTATRTI